MSVSVAGASYPASTAVAASLPTWPVAPDWQGYVEGNGAATLAPVSVSASGNVTNAQALVSGSGVTTLTDVVGQASPIVVLDYGKEVGGLPLFQVSSVKATSPATSVTMRAGYSEARQYLLGSGSATVMGDANGNNGVGTDGARADNFTLTSAAGGTMIGNAANAVQGGERL